MPVIHDHIYEVTWGMVGIVVLVPAFCLWVRRRRETESLRESWRRADQAGRRRARDERIGH